MIPLNVHSVYTMLESTATLDELIEKALHYGLKALALTDLNGMYGLVQFFKKASAAGIKPLLGTMIDEPSDPSMSALLIARSNSGYADMCKIITTRKLKEDFSLKGLLQNYYPELFVITGSLSLLKSIPRHDNLFAELIAAEGMKAKTREVYNYARQQNIPFVASSPVYFARKEDYMLHKVVSAIKHNTTLANLKPGELVNPEYYFRDPAELRELWKSLPEAILNTERIADGCEVDLQPGKLKFPEFTLPEGETSSTSLLTKLAYEGLRQRYDNITEEINKRMVYELEVINELNFTDYFLVVWDIVTEAKKRGMMMLGRGSAANSLVSYCLGFSEVDPVKYNLYFERFLNRARKTPPDVDIDFSWKERDGLVRYVFEKYGYSRVAMISSHITFKARSAFRESAKVFGISDREITNINMYIPWTDAHNLPHVSELYPEAKELDFTVEPWKTIVDYAVRIADFPRHLSIHPCGIVVAPGKITDHLALEFAKNKGLGLIVTQPDMYSVEDIGLVKIDLLSQRSLGVLRDTMLSIQNSDDIDVGPPP